MEPSTEIRRMREDHVENLAHLLDKCSFWKQLMKVIPIDLQYINATDLTTSTEITRKYQLNDVV